MRSLRFTLIATVAAVGASLAMGRAATAGIHHVSDGSVRVGLPRGWHASVGPGIQSGHRVAWILLADFALATNAATIEGGPSVPDRKVLVAVGDFVPVGIAADWRRVSRVVLPARLSRRVAWNVRLGGRALRLTVSFGSTPTTRTRSIVNRVLASIRHV